MVLTRLCGHLIIEILGVVNIVKLCSISSMIGAILLVAINDIQVSYFAFSLLGGVCDINAVSFLKSCEN